MERKYIQEIYSKPDYSELKGTKCAKSRKKGAVVFQGKKFRACVDIYSWLWWGEYLFRFWEVQKFLGIKTESETMGSLTEIALDIIDKVGERPFLEVLEEIQEMWSIEKGKERLKNGEDIQPTYRQKDLQGY